MIVALVFLFAVDSGVGHESGLMGNNEAMDKQKSVIAYLMTCFKDSSLVVHGILYGQTDSIFNTSDVSVAILYLCTS